MRSRLPGGLRAQIAVAIALVTSIGVVATCLALYTGLSARLRSQIDASLRVQRDEWRTFTAGASLSTPAALQHQALRFIGAQRYHAESLMIAIQLLGGRPQLVSNSPERGVSPQDLAVRSPPRPGSRAHPWSRPACSGSWWRRSSTAPGGWGCSGSQARSRRWRRRSRAFAARS